MDFKDMNEYPKYKINKNGDVYSKFNDRILKRLDNKYVKLINASGVQEKLNVKDLVAKYWPKIENANMYIVFYKLNNSICRTYDPFNEIYENKSTFEINNHVRFYMMKGYECSD